MLMGFMTLPIGAPTNAFYESWADYLQPYPTIFLKTAAIFGHWIAVLFYNLGSAVLDAWHGAWSLANFSTLFTSKHADNMTGFQLTQYIGLFFMIGLIIMSIMMAIQIMQFTMTSGRRGKEWPAGIVTALIVIWMVPMLISGGTSVAKAMNNRILGTETQQNVLTKIWRSNTVDLTKLANANFDVHGGNPNQYSPITNNSSNDVVKTTIFTDVLDDENQKKLIPNSNNRSIFTKKYGSKSAVNVDKGTFLTKSAAAEVYPRVKTNWFGIIAAELVFAVVGFLAITELIVRFYRLAYYSLTLLVFAFRDMEGKKAMQILHVMEGSIVGIAILPVNLLMFFGFTQWGMNTIGKLNLGWAPYTVLIIALMLAAMKGLMGGFALIDDWTGVPTGSGATMTGLVGAAATANGVARGAVAGGKTISRTATTAAVSLKDRIAQAGEGAAKIRETVNNAGNTTGLMPNRPMPQGVAQGGAGLLNSNSAPSAPQESNKVPGLTPEAPKPTATENESSEAVLSHPGVNHPGEFRETVPSQVSIGHSGKNVATGSAEPRTQGTTTASTDSSAPQESPYSPIQPVGQETRNDDVEYQQGESNALVPPVGSHIETPANEAEMNDNTVPLVPLGKSGSMDQAETNRQPTEPGQNQAQGTLNVQPQGLNLANATKAPQSQATVNSTSAAPNSSIAPVPVRPEASQEVTGDTTVAKSGHQGLKTKSYGQEQELKDQSNVQGQPQSITTVQTDMNAGNSASPANTPVNSNAPARNAAPGSRQPTEQVTKTESTRPKTEQVTEATPNMAKSDASDPVAQAMARAKRTAHVIPAGPAAKPQAGRKATHRE